MKSRRANTFEINGLKERRALSMGANAGDSVINVCELLVQLADYWIHQWPKMNWQPCKVLGASIDIDDWVVEVKTHDPGLCSGSHESLVFAFLYCIQFKAVLHPVLILCCFHKCYNKCIFSKKASRS